MQKRKLLLFVFFSLSFMSKWTNAAELADRELQTLADRELETLDTAQPSPPSFSNEENSDYEENSDLPKTVAPSTHLPEKISPEKPEKPRFLSKTKETSSVEEAPLQEPPKKEGWLAKTKGFFKNLFGKKEASSVEEAPLQEPLKKKGWFAKTKGFFNNLFGKKERPFVEKASLQEPIKEERMLAKTKERPPVSPAVLENSSIVESPSASSFDESKKVKVNFNDPAKMEKLAARIAALKERLRQKAQR